MSDLAELFARAVGLELKGQAMDAIEAYKRVLALDPSNGAAHAGIGFVFCALSWIDFDRSCWLLKASEEFRLAGTAFLDSKSYEEAHRMFNLILDLKGSDAESHFNIGRVCHRLGKIDSALEHYKTAASQNPRDFRYHNNIGALYAERKCHAEAITTYKTLLELSPNDGTANYNLACAHYRRKNYELCIRHARTAKSLGMNREKVDQLLGLLPPSLAVNSNE